MLLFSETADRIASTTKKREKTAILAEYFSSVPHQDAATGAVFFSGRPFPAWEEATLQVGGSILWRIVAELSRRGGRRAVVALSAAAGMGVATLIERI